MANLRKVRVTVGTPSHVSKVATIEELGSGDLLIYPARPPEVGPSVNPAIQQPPPNVHFAKFKQLRVSVHVSPDSPGHTVVRHTESEEGTYTKHYAYYVPRDADGLWPLFITRSPYLSSDRYKYSRKANEEEVSIGDQFDSQFCSLFYGLLVSLPKRPLAVCKLLNKVSINFEQFSVHVIYGYTATISVEKSFNIYPVTAMRDSGGAGQDIVIDQNAKSYSKKKLESFFNKGFRALAEANAELARAEFLPDISDHELTFFSQLRKKPVSEGDIRSPEVIVDKFAKHAR